MWSCYRVSLYFCWSYHVSSISWWNTELEANRKQPNYAVFLIIYAQASAIFTRRDWFSIGKHKKCQLVIWLGQNGLGYQSATKYVRSHCHWLQNDHKAEWQTGSDQKSEMILSMWAAIWGSRCGSGLCLSFQVCSSTPAITWNCSLPGLPFTFEQAAPGSAPGTGGPHFLTWTWAFHQEPDHSWSRPWRWTQESLLQWCWGWAPPGWPSDRQQLSLRTLIVDS